ncbi:MAG: DUF2303 family protein [Gemmatimonadota bacterium]
MSMISDFLGALRAVASDFNPPTVDVPGDGDAHDGMVRYFVRDGYTLAEVNDEAPRRHHTVNDVESLVSWAKRHADPTTATLFYGDAFVLILDDRHTGEGGHERVTYTPGPTEAARDWDLASVLQRNGAGALKLDHLRLKRLVEEYAAEIDSPALLEALSHFKARTTLEYDAKLDDSESFGFVVRTGQDKMGGQARIPRAFTLTIPLFVGLDVRYEIRWLLTWEQQEAKVVFTLEPRRLAEVIDDAREDLIAGAREALGDGWLIVRGSPHFDE